MPPNTLPLLLLPYRRPSTQRLLHSSHQFLMGLLSLFLLTASITTNNACFAHTIAWGRFYGTPRFPVATASQKTIAQPWPPLLTLASLHKHSLQSSASLKPTARSIAISIPWHLYKPHPTGKPIQPILLKGHLKEDPHTHALLITLH